MATKYADPEVKLLHSFDGRLDAWRISRPYLNPEDINLEDITSMDLEVAGAAVYHFYIKSSIFFRDLLFTVRNGIGGIWARSNRTIPYNEDNLFLSSEYKEHDEYLQDCMNEVYATLYEGQPQDYAKKLLPMATSTEYSLYMDDRTLVTFLKTLKSVNINLYNVYGKLFLEAIGRDDSYVENRNCKSIYDSLAISDTEYLMLETHDNAHHVGTMYIGIYEISANLMSQFIRQHYSKVHNELWNYAKRDHQSNLSNIYKLRCNDDVVVSLYAEESAFNKVISVRSCEFAQWDKEDNSSWSSIIGGFVESMATSTFMYNLPCKGNCNKCGILKDMMERINCVEVNMPCSILTENPELLVIRSYKYESDSKIYKKYERMINFSNRNLHNKYFHKFYSNLQNKLDDHSTKEWDIYREFYGDPKLLFYELAVKEIPTERVYVIDYDGILLNVSIEDALKFYRYRIFGNQDISQKDAQHYHDICTKLLSDGIVKYSEWLYSLTIVKELCYYGDGIDDSEIK